MNGLHWKTNWLPTDNHARDGASDLVRLLANYEQLKQLLNAEYGFRIDFEVPVTNGYASSTFADMFNSIEACMNALHVWTVAWQEKSVLWSAGMTAPTNEDINRWEQNGMEIEEASKRIKAAYYYSGELFSGEV